MRTLKLGLYPGGRLDYGAAIVAAADTVDVSPVQKRFDAFALEQQRYTGTHGTVQTAVSDLRERRTVLVQLDLAQDEAIEEVACRLALEGHTRANPFAVYDVDAPFALKLLNYGEKATAIHTLVAMVHADTTLSAATQHAAQAAEETARQMETALVPFDKLQTSLRTARAARQAAGKQWDKAFKALKLDAQAADLEGGFGLEKALLEDVKPPKKPVAATKKPAAADKQQAAADKQQAAADKQQTPGAEHQTDADKQETTDKAATPAAATAEVKTS